MLLNGLMRMFEDQRLIFIVKFLQSSKCPLGVLRFMQKRATLCRCAQLWKELVGCFWRETSLLCWIAMEVSTYAALKEREMLILEELL